MQRRLATFFSYLLHPLLMPTYMTAMFFFMNIYIGFNISSQSKGFILLLVFFNTFFVPLVSSLMLRRLGVIESLEMQTTAERRWPLLITAIFYIFTYYLLLKIRLSGVVYVALLGAIIALTVTTLINFRWKISAHMVGIGGITGVFLGLAIRLGADTQYVILLLIFLSGILGFSRLRLEAHNPKQLYSGYLLGLLCQLVLFLAV
jgi:hypothetical protein